LCKRVVVAGPWRKKLLTCLVTDLLGEHRLRRIGYALLYGVGGRLVRFKVARMIKLRSLVKLAQEF
jgi:hypothetical protein